MLQINFLRQNIDLVVEKLRVKHFGNPEIVDTILLLDEKRRKILTDKEELLAKRNASSKAIGQLMAKGLKEEAEAQQEKVEEVTRAWSS